MSKIPAEPAVVSAEAVVSVEAVVSAEAEVSAEGPEWAEVLRLRPRLPPGRIPQRKRKGLRSIRPLQIVSEAFSSLFLLALQVQFPGQSLLFAEKQ